MPTETFPALFVKVSDGDTVHLDIRVSASAVWKIENWVKGRRYRLARINAPELSTAEGKASAAALTTFCATFSRDGWWAIGEKFDPYGRLVTEVVAPDGTNLSEYQLANGNAVPVSYKLAKDGETLLMVKHG